MNTFEFQYHFYQKYSKTYMTTEFSTPINNLQISSTDIIQDIQNELDAKNNINDSIHERTLDTNTNILPLSATTIQDIESSNLKEANKIAQHSEVYNEKEMTEDIEEDEDDGEDDDENDDDESLEEKDKSMLDYAMDFLGDVKNFSKLVILFVAIGVMFYYLNKNVLANYYVKFSIINKHPVVMVMLDNLIKAVLFLFFMKYVL